jgi:hypothetical protein
MVKPLAGKLPSNQGPVAHAAAFARLG